MICKKFLLAIFSIIFSSSVFSFKIHDPRIHENITLEGLLNVSYPIGGERRLFSVFSFQNIIQGNKDTDILEAFVPFRHFDNEELDRGIDYLANAASDIVDMMSSSSPWASAREARDLLGKSLHTLQDFYSHSNWIELGNTNIVDFYNISNMIDFERGPIEIGEVCGIEDGNILLDGNLTTGYFKLVGEDIPEDIQNIGKCRHGNPFSCDARGINKDIACPHNRITHMLAVQLAIRETQTYVQSIVNEIGLSGDIRGVCAFMGISEEDCPEEVRFLTGASIHEAQVFNTDPNSTATFDVATSWEGNPEFPVTLFTSSDAECRSEECVIGIPQIYETEQNPLIWQGGCFGYVDPFTIFFGGPPVPFVPITLTSYVFLEDANGVVTTNSSLVQTDCTFTP